jgi:hypothetical protein
MSRKWKIILLSIIFFNLVLIVALEYGGDSEHALEVDNSSYSKCDSPNGDYDNLTYSFLKITGWRTMRKVVYNKGYTVSGDYTEANLNSLVECLVDRTKAEQGDGGDFIEYGSEHVCVMLYKSADKLKESPFEHTSPVFRSQSDVGTVLVGDYMVEGCTRRGSTNGKEWTPTYITKNSMEFPD